MLAALCEYILRRWRGRDEGRARRPSLLDQRPQWVWLCRGDCRPRPQPRQLRDTVRSAAPPRIFVVRQLAAGLAELDTQRSRCGFGHGTCSL
eukprot:scaffold200727_cov32-Prasinocladus_malaysianus.AAC.1